MRLAAGVAGALFIAAALPAGATSGTEATVAERPQAEAIVERLIELVHQNYVLEDRLEAVEERLRAGLTAGRYREVTDPRSLSALLTAELRAGSGDLHFGVRPKPADSGEHATGAVGEPPSEGDSGLGRVAILDGNVGYVEVRGFPDPVVGRAAVDEAFQRLAETDALILDLRWSRGGRPQMVAYLLSYLFDREPFVFNRFHWRNSGETVDFWTRSDVPAPRYAGSRVFALTSRRTPSAAEGFCYHLQQFERATLVGEPTIGAAHTYTVYTLDELQVAIPTGRPISPVSGGNWQGTGVVPDHEVAAGEALVVAYRLVLEGLLAEVVDPAVRTRLEAALESQPDDDE
ncbi:MAG: S41 family peptidase [Thermoanaerobaculia bacterium]